MWLYLLIAALLGLAIGVQVYYLRTYAAQANGVTKALIVVNICLLAAVMGVLLLFAVRTGGS